MNALAEETRATLPSPQMMSGHLEGRLLEMLVHATGAKRVLELGTYSGYSALAMASAMEADGRIITCEYEDAHADFAQRHIDASPYADRIEIRRGPALETIATLEGPFELIFIDADKVNYERYFEAALPLLAPRGLIVIDNTLWSGNVLPEYDDGEPNTRALRELNESSSRTSAWSRRAAGPRRRHDRAARRLTRRTTGRSTGRRAQYLQLRPREADENDALVPDRPAMLQLTPRLTGFSA